MATIKLSKPIRMTNKRADMIRAAEFFITSLRISKHYANVLIEFRYFHTFLTGNLAHVERSGLDYKLVIECDENNHDDRDPIQEKNRENYITSLGNKIIRFNPNDSGFDLSTVLREINVILFSNKL